MFIRFGYGCVAVIVVIVLLLANAGAVAAQEAVSADLPLPNVDCSTGEVVAKWGALPGFGQFTACFVNTGICESTQLPTDSFTLHTGSAVIQQGDQIALYWNNELRFTWTMPLGSLTCGAATPPTPEPKAPVCELLLAAKDNYGERVASTVRVNGLRVGETFINDGFMKVVVPCFTWAYVSIGGVPFDMKLAGTIWLTPTIPAATPNLCIGAVDRDITQ